VGRALLSGEFHRGLHQRLPESLPTSLGNHVEVLQVGVERLVPERRAESEHRQPVRLRTSEEDRDLAGSEELPNALGEDA
jgi:hypothetical protein